MRYPPRVVSNSSATSGPRCFADLISALSVCLGGTGLCSRPPLRCFSFSRESFPRWCTTCKRSCHVQTSLFARLSRRNRRAHCLSTCRYDRLHVCSPCLQCPDSHRASDRFPDGRGAQCVGLMERSLPRVHCSSSRLSRSVRRRAPAATRALRISRCPLARLRAPRSTLQRFLRTSHRHHHLLSRLEASRRLSQRRVGYRLIRCGTQAPE